MGVPGIPDEGRSPGDEQGEWLTSGPLPDPDTVRVPDDLSELDHEVRAMRRELAQDRRRTAWRHAALVPYWRRIGVSLPVVLSVLVIIALLASVVNLVLPRTAVPLPHVSLGQPTAAVGEVGGLLPVMTLSQGGVVVTARDRRPAALVLVPPDCGCDDVLDRLYLQVKTLGLPFYLVGPTARADELDQLDRRTGNGGASVLIDRENRLATTYAAVDLTLILVGADGLVQQILHDPTLSTRVSVAA